MSLFDQLPHQLCFTPVLLDTTVCERVNAIFAVQPRPSVEYSFETNILAKWPWSQASLAHTFRSTHFSWMPSCWIPYQAIRCHILTLKQGTCICLRHISTNMRHEITFWNLDSINHRYVCLFQLLSCRVLNWRLWTLIDACVHYSWFW